MSVRTMPRIHMENMPPSVAMIRTFCSRFIRAAARSFAGTCHRFRPTPRNVGSECTFLTRYQTTRVLTHTGRRTNTAAAAKQIIQGSTKAMTALPGMGTADGEPQRMTHGDALTLRDLPPADEEPAAPSSKPGAE